ncbi:hypothetical protein BGC07_00575 [Piscirickettsia litoralis]|uniref:Major facilitator superfamily (MFS) profile domain-containing protein n=2 Tax=Piscirickettsia litoralis TaxID=1891921 RepID=A0ABX3A264_9GAMM|nr:hypothetical protein [Piscirickettsia litoralis]ODN41751.1 hypothetical protein BGC07_00575 [Piscirickettsia litoralis]
MAIISLTTASIFLFNTVGPFLIQNKMGYSAISFGYMALIVGAAYATGALGSRFFDKSHPAQIIFFNISMLLIGSITMTLWSWLAPLNLLSLIIPSCFLAFVCGMIYPALITLMFRPFPEHTGLVSSCYGLSSYLLSGLIVWIVGELAIQSVFGFAIVCLLLSLLVLALGLFLTSSQDVKQFQVQT